MPVELQEYLQGCRNRIEPFVARHFSLAQTWNLQRQTLWKDLFLAPVNVAWAVPYLAIRKASDIATRMGLIRLGTVLAKTPAGIPTGYQAAIEQLVWRELLHWQKGLGPQVVTATPLNSHTVIQLEAALRQHVEQFSSFRGLVVDLATNVITLIYGWYFFGNGSLGIESVARRLARAKAKQEAADDFFLGSSLGNSYYELFPPSANVADTRMYMVLLVAGLIAGSFTLALVADPVRKKFSLHQANLRALIEAVERETVFALYQEGSLRPKAGRLPTAHPNLG